MPASKQASKSLNSLIKSVPRKVARTASAEIAFGAENVEFTWREPDTDTLFAIHEDAAAIKKQYGFREALCLQVASMGCSHVAPLSDGDTPARFYAELANANPEIFAAVLTAFNTAFTLDPEAAVVEAKND
jgi:hypothetical protein